MSDKPRLPLSPEAPDTETAAWWEQTLTRRDAHRLGAAALLGASLLGSAQLQGCCGSDDEDLDDIQEEDALKLQKEGGWDVGASDRQLAFTGAQTIDSLGSDGWKNYLKASNLLEVIEPGRRDWLTYQGNNLPQALEVDTLKSQLKPVVTDAMREAYFKGRSTGSLVAASEDARDTFVIVDLPGPEAVAFAAGMAERVEPVFGFDNWPHPDGVVPSHMTLGALLYYGEELKAAKAKRKKEEADGAAVALILDSSRLATYTDDAGQFDNRYIATVPDEAALKRLKVKRVLYVSSGAGEKELDDLNDSLVDYEDNGIPVQLVSTRAFSKDPKDPDPEKRTGGYYYGGSHGYHPYFYTHYPMFIWVHTGGYYSTWSRSPTPPPTTVARPSTYKPTRRSTLFSGAKNGGVAGRPASFGRVSSRRSSSGGVTWSKGSSSSSSSRSGSWGRSRSGGGSSG